MMCFDDPHSSTNLTRQRNSHPLFTYYTQHNILFSIYTYIIYYGRQTNTSSVARPHIQGTDEIIGSDAFHNHGVIPNSSSD